MNGDRIARCLLEGGRIRLVVVTTTALARQGCTRHGLVGLGAVALARAMSSGLLLATLTKGNERVTLQILGDGPLGSITVDASSAGRVRAFVRERAVVLPGTPGLRVSVARAVGKTGLCSVARDLGLAQTFTGQTELTEGEVDTDVESYLQTSEQIESALRCEALLGADMDIESCAGVLFQALPGSSEVAAVSAFRETLREGALLDVLKQPGSSSFSAADVAAQLVGDGAGLEVLDERPLQFFCPCSRERAASTLAMLGADDLTALARDPGEAEVACEFCRASYRFDAAELLGLRDELVAHMTSGPSQRPS